MPVLGNDPNHAGIRARKGDILAVLKAIRRSWLIWKYEFDYARVYPVNRNTRSSQQHDSSTNQNQGPRGNYAREDQ